MAKDSKTVSVIIPTIGRPGFLAAGLQSLMRQTYPKWEALVVADGVDEDMFRQLVSIAEGDPRVKVEKRAGHLSGAPSCRNQGLQGTAGDYVVFLDDDDCLSSGCLLRRVAFIEDRPQLAFAVSHCQIFKAVPGDTPRFLNVRTAQDDLDRFLAFDVPWQTACLTWRRTALEKLGGWTDGLPSFQDWDLHVRALAEGLQYEWLENPPDCFWRLPQKTSETIGVNSASGGHLRSHFGLFMSVADRLAAGEGLTGHRRALVPGLFFWLAESWYKLGRPDEALSVWERCRESILLTQAQYVSGRRALTSPARMFLRRLLRKLFFYAYPTDFRAGDYSRTIRRCRIMTQ